MSDMAVVLSVLAACVSVLGTSTFLIWREDRRWRKWWNGES